MNENANGAGCGSLKTVVLCGGYGTRIRDMGANVPKPMITVGRYPILWHIMRYYAHHGFSCFVLCLGYRSDAIKAFFLNYHNLTRDFTIQLGRDAGIQYHGVGEDEPDWRVTLAETGLEAMTGARVRRVRRYLDGDEDFMLTYGDGLGDVDLRSLVQFHRAHGKVMTVTGVLPPGRFGELEIAEGGCVIGFNEKPQVSGGRISGGFFVCRRELFDYLDDREDLVLEQEPMRKLVADGEMMVYPHDGFWSPMDTPRDHRLLSELWESGRAPWKVW